jgi:YegS/Rv2252/BmrU family lipid kinase
MAYASLIHCPRGGSASEEDLEQARALLSQGLDLEVLRVEGDRSPADLARQALDAGSKVVIASGGDGSVSSVASVIVGREDVALGILPRGTANSIAAFLGIARDLEAACAIICAGHTRSIDTARVNNLSMVLMATVGLHAEAITDVDPERKQRFGAFAYVLEEVERMLDAKLFDVTVEANGQVSTFPVNAVTVANIARPATLVAQGPGTIIEDDGLLDVTLVAIRGFADAVATSWHLATAALRQQPAERDNVGFFRAKRIRITTAEPKRVMVDGEDATETPLVIECVPRSLRVLVPKE